LAPKLLSKSKYISGLQCLKYLWLQVNDPAAVPQPDTRTQHLFDQGHLVQQYAEKLFPGGIRVPESTFKKGIDATQRLLKEGKTFFEAGILSDRVYSRVDVLRPAGGGKWDILEVKSSTRVKDENIEDVSFQKYCCEKSGLAINRCYLVHVNNKYTRQGEIDPQGLLVTEDVSDQVAEAMTGIDGRVAAMLEIMSAKEPPTGKVGLHCKEPYDCPVAACWNSLPENNVLHLYRGGSKSFDLLEQGVCFLKDIPDSVRLSEAQKIQKWCDVNDRAHFDRTSVGSFINSLKYPLHYLDFETFNAAVPLLDGTRPYQQVPFQFSLHVVDKPGAMAWHFGHLADSPSDPRPVFFAELRKAIGNKGSILVYNQKFEEDIIRVLGQAYPEQQDWVDLACSRMVDLLAPFRSFAYYHPAQNGSASIKAVMPALTGRGYDGLDIAVGDEASLAYLDMTYGNMPAAEKARTRKDLEVYCGRDTEGMIWIVDRLKELMGQVADLSREGA
jgi:hypothetical protein